MFLIDTNAVLDILSPASPWADWSTDAIADAKTAGWVAINPIIYAELAVPYDRVADLDLDLRTLSLRRLPLPYEAAFLAGRAFREHRQRGGSRAAPMSDFYIGAHAAFARLGIVTRDPQPYRSYFPSVQLMTPQRA